MGTSAFNVHVHSDQPDAVTAALDEVVGRQGYVPDDESARGDRSHGSRPARRGFWLAPAQAGWVSLLDSATAAMEQTAQELSARLKTDCLFAYVNDSDGWGFTLYRDGKKATQFSTDEEDEDGFDEDAAGAGPVVSINTVQEQLAKMQQLLNASMPPDMAEVLGRMRSGTATAQDRQRHAQWVMGNFKKVAGDVFGQGPVAAALQRSADRRKPAGSPPPEPPDPALDAVVTELTPLLQPGVTAEQLVNVLRRKELFAESILADFFPLLGIRPDFAHLCYNHLRHGPNSHDFPSLPPLSHRGYRLEAFPCR